METKICFKCGGKKTLECFYKHPQMLDGHVNKCKECNKNDVKKNYISKIDDKREYDIYRQRYSFQRIFNHRYANIKSRCDGKIKCSIRYKDKQYLEKSEFIKWCYSKKTMEKFLKLWTIWKDSNFSRNLTPSIDRIDNTMGYLSNNIQWLSSIDNTKKHYNKNYNKG